VKTRLIQNDLAADLPAIASAEGVWLVDTAGRRYIDGCSGAVVTLIGHGHPRVVAAIAAQAATVTFVHRGAFTGDAVNALADRLGALTGYAGVWFVTSGSEAVEAAMQFALQYFRETGQPGRQWFLSSARGYHGNTLGGLSLSGHARRAVVGDLAHTFSTLPTPDEHDDVEKLLELAASEFERHAHHLAGVVIEPVGGATLGATVPPPGYLEGLKALCEQHGALFIADEVMTGFGRCGTLLASTSFGVWPDLVATGKGLGAGYAPIAATLVSAPVVEAIERGSGRIAGGHTYAGNPLSVATAAAVLDVIVDEDVIARGAAVAPLLRDGLAALRRGHPHVVADVRGLGLLRAIELRSAEPQGTVARRLAAAAMRHGAVVYATTGGFNDAVLVAPPLTISEPELTELLARLDAALGAL
jgi:adenosylmethionine-8-amino-7-oxononanoate aminotransferase